MCVHTIGSATRSSVSQTPIDSKMLRLAALSAMQRSSQEGSPDGGGADSIRAIARFVFASAAARLAPTRPPPTTAMSTTVDLVMRASTSRSRGRPWAVGGEDARPLAVTSTSSSMRTPMFQKRFGTLSRRADVEARLDGEHHAGLQLARTCPSMHVVAGVVHVQAEPVAGAVHVELLVACRPRARRRRCPCSSLRSMMPCASTRVAASW